MLSWNMVVAGIMVVTSGYTLGAVFAKVMCLPLPQVIAVSIETALQNPGVAFILLKLSLDSPYRFVVILLSNLFGDKLSNLFGDKF